MPLASSAFNWTAFGAFCCIWSVASLGGDLGGSGGGGNGGNGGNGGDGNGVTSPPTPARQKDVRSGSGGGGGGGGTLDVKEWMTEATKAKTHSSATNGTLLQSAKRLGCNYG